MPRIVSVLYASNHSNIKLQFKGCSVTARGPGVKLVGSQKVNKDNNAVIDLGSKKYSEMTPWGSLVPLHVLGFHLSLGHKAVLYQQFSFFCIYIK